MSFPNNNTNPPPNISQALACNKKKALEDWDMVRSTQNKKEIRKKIEIVFT